MISHIFITFDQRKIKIKEEIVYNSETWSNNRSIHIILFYKYFYSHRNYRIIAVQLSWLLYMESHVHYFDYCTQPGKVKTFKLKDYLSLLCYQDIQWAMGSLMITHCPHEQFEVVFRNFICWPILKNKIKICPCFRKAWNGDENILRLTSCL